MESPKLVEWLNLLAAAGVLVGLAFVAYEVRQTNDIAFAEARSDMLSGYQEQAMSTYGPEISGSFIKSIEEPHQLSDEEILKVNNYLVAAMSMINKQAVLYYQFGRAAEPTDDILDAARFYLGGSFARSWWQLNKYWMDPTLVETVERHLAENPPTNTWDYADLIRSSIPSPADDGSAQTPN